MADEKKITWDDAIASSGYVSLPEGETKKLVLTNWTFEEVDKFDKKVIEFQAEVLFEDGESCKEKTFTTSSNRLKKKLRPIFEKKSSTDKVKITIIRVGDKFDTQYSVKELKD